MLVKTDHDRHLQRLLMLHALRTGPAHGLRNGLHAGPDGCCSCHLSSHAGGPRTVTGDTARVGQTTRSTATRSVSPPPAESQTDRPDSTRSSIRLSLSDKASVRIRCKPVDAGLLLAARLSGPIASRKSDRPGLSGADDPCSDQARSATPGAGVIRPATGASECSCSPEPPVARTAVFQRRA